MRVDRERREPLRECERGKEGQAFPDKSKPVKSIQSLDDKSKCPRYVRYARLSKERVKARVEPPSGPPVRVERIRDARGVLVGSKSEKGSLDIREGQEVKGPTIVVLGS